jgi:hypothetical protein
MSTPPVPTRELTGKRIGWWYIVAFAGQRDGVNYWQGHCCHHGRERVLAETDLLNQKNDPLRQQPCLCRKLEGELADFIFGLWTVIELADGGKRRAFIQRGLRLWKCRCACGTESAIQERDLTSWQTLSCGCRPEQVISAELGSRHQRAWKSFSQAMRRIGRRERDSRWTPEMDHALRTLQPACVVCGGATDLTTHHVRPFSEGYGLEPGNAVRLCRACNSFIGTADPSHLPPEMARKIARAAAKFKEYWESGCPAPKRRATAPAQKMPKLPNPALIGMLRAVQRGEDAAIPALASWLRKRRDPRARAIGDLARLEVVVKETQLDMYPNEVHYSIVFRLDGKSSGGSLIGPRSPDDTEDSLARQVQEEVQRHRANEVWRRLGLSNNDVNALWQYLGIGPPPCGMSSRLANKAQRLQQAGKTTPEALPGDAMPGGVSVAEIARREGVRVQTIRNRIAQALHRLATPQGHRRH